MTFLVSVSLYWCMLIYVSSGPHQSSILDLCVMCLNLLLLIFSAHFPTYFLVLRFPPTSLTLHFWSPVVLCSFPFSGDQSEEITQDKTLGIQICNGYMGWKPRKEIEKRYEKTRKMQSHGSQGRKELTKAVVFHSVLLLQGQIREAKNIFSVRNMAVVQKHILVETQKGKPYRGRFYNGWEVKTTLWRS